ncbi:hypothetical protein KKC97_12790 [bacterium]|nr:hypothetical protein [bacterium]MBU1919670.1 hypothetical protein [bacterium]
MEKKCRLLQRGAADLVAVAVGMTLLAITAVGTSYSLLYGRQALIQQEHYKVASYMLRGELEREVARFQVFGKYRDRFDSYLDFGELNINLDSPNDRDGDVNMTRGRINRDPVVKIDRQETGEGTDYYRIVMRAEWTESVYPGALDSRSRNKSGTTHEILLATTFLVQSEL